MKRSRSCAASVVVAALLALAAVFSPVFAVDARAQQPLDPPERDGFPVLIPGAGTDIYAQPAIADLGLDPDGFESIVFGLQSGQLYVMLADGTVAPGFPRTLPAAIISSPAIGDLDGDAIPEIVVGFGSNFEPLSHGGIRAYRRDGTVLWTRNSKDFGGEGWRDPVFSTPAIGDVDGDGDVEVAYASFDARVYLVNGADGTNQPGWPQFVRDTIWSSPALHDLDGDGKLEVIVGVDAHLEGIPYNTPDGGCLHAYRFDGSELNGFPVCVDQVLVSSPAIGDLDGDDVPDIVIGTGTYWPDRTHAVYAFRNDGSALPGWPVAVDGQVSTSPALADLDGDGDLDVVVTSDDTGPSGTFHVDAFDGDGTRLFPSVEPLSFFGYSLSAGEPVVADVTGDAAPEILFPTSTEVCVVSSTGAQLTDPGTHAGAFSMYTTTSLSNVAVGDLDGDGVPEVVAVSAAPFPAATDTEVHVWNPLSRTAAAPPWGMFRAGPLRRGVAAGTLEGTGSRYGALEVYVRRLFLDFLLREPGAGEMQPWIDAIESQETSRAEAGLAFLQSEDYRRARETVARYHLAFFGKPPSFTILERFTRRLVAAGCTGMVCSEAKRRDIAAKLATKPPFKRRFPASLTNEQFVRALYQKILGRTPSSEDVAGWSASLDNGMTRSEAARLFADSGEYVNDRTPWSVFVILAHAGFLQSKVPGAELAAWVADLKLAHPPRHLVQELITSDGYLERLSAP